MYIFFEILQKYFIVNTLCATLFPVYHFQRLLKITSISRLYFIRLFPCYWTFRWLPIFLCFEYLNAYGFFLLCNSVPRTRSQEWDCQIQEHERFYGSWFSKGMHKSAIPQWHMSFSSSLTALILDLINIFGVI